MNAVASKTIFVSANKFDMAILDVIGETEKAYNVKNRDCGRTCWIPKSGLYLRKPGVATYEDEYEVHDWFYNRMSNPQMKVLNVME
jgi:hypothetical protein